MSRCPPKAPAGGPSAPCSPSGHWFRSSRPSSRGCATGGSWSSSPPVRSPPQTRPESPRTRRWRPCAGASTRPWGYSRAARAGVRLGGQWVYQLPWYIIIGPPGSGKTTALVNSGLRFPLAEQPARRHPRHRRHPQLRLVVHRRGGDPGHRRPLHHPGQPRRGGQRRLARLPGPAQEAPAAPAHQRRPGGRQPVGPAAAVRGRARRPRPGHPGARPGDYTNFRIRFPIYVLFTKADLVAGFTEFFADLGQEGRGQVWGMTFPYDDGSAGVPPAGGAGRPRPQCLRRRAPRPGGASRPTPARAHAAGAGCGKARTGVQLPTAVRVLKRNPGAVSGRDLRPQPL